MRKKYPLMAGGFLIFLGFAGFLPNPLVGDAGFFKADLLHNLVHIFLGGILLISPFRDEKSSRFMVRLIGGIFLALAVLGFLFAKNDRLLGMELSGTAENWLHLLLGMGIIFFTGSGFAANAPENRLTPGQ